MTEPRRRIGSACADPKPGFDRHGRESGPAADRPRSRFWFTIGAPAAEAVDAGPFVGLQLEQLDDPHRFARGSDDAQVAFGGSPA